MLQWGHADVGVEDVKRLARIFRPRKKLQWGHADVGVEDRERSGPQHVVRRRFNGATPMSAWKTPFTPTSVLTLTVTGTKLQWGHADVGVEDAGRSS